jgi:hypothetical protein
VFAELEGVAEVVFAEVEGAAEVVFDELEGVTETEVLAEVVGVTETDVLAEVIGFAEVEVWTEEEAPAETVVVTSVFLLLQPEVRSIPTESKANRNAFFFIKYPLTFSSKNYSITSEKRRNLYFFFGCGCG